MQPKRSKADQCNGVVKKVHVGSINEMVYGDEKMKYRQAKKVLDNMHNGTFGRTIKLTSMPKRHTKEGMGSF